MEVSTAGIRVPRTICLLVEAHNPRSTKADDRVHDGRTMEGRFLGGRGLRARLRMKGTFLAIFFEDEGHFVRGTIFSEIKNILKHCYNDGVVLTMCATSYNDIFYCNVVA